MNEKNLVHNRLVSVNTNNKPLISGNGTKNLIDNLQVYKLWQVIKCL